MAVRSKTGTGAVQHQPGKPKRTRQGASVRTNVAASSRNGRGKKYRGQGR
jgi:hypothetical protein